NQGGAGIRRRTGQAQSGDAQRQGPRHHGLACEDGQLARSSASLSALASLPFPARGFALVSLADSPGGGAFGSSLAAATREVQFAESSVPTFSNGNSAANGVATTPSATAAPARAISGPFCTPTSGFLNVPLAYRGERRVNIRKVLFAGRMSRSSLSVARLTWPVMSTMVSSVSSRKARTCMRSEERRGGKGW